MLENKVLRKIFGAKRDEITGKLRKLHNAELHALYSLPNIIRNLKSRQLRWAGYVARMKQSRNTYRILVGKSEESRPLGRPRHSQSIIVFCPRAGLSLQTQHSPIYPFFSLSFHMFIQFIYHNVVYCLISSSASNFLPIYHTF